MGLYQYGFTKREVKEEPPLWKYKNDAHNTPYPTRIFLLFCGCGSLSNRIRQVLEYAGLLDVPKEKLTLSIEARRFVEENRLDLKVESLSRSTYAVLVNPKTGSLLDIGDKSIPVEELQKKAFLMAKGEL